MAISPRMAQEQELQRFEKIIDSHLCIDTFRSEKIIPVENVAGLTLHLWAKYLKPRYLAAGWNAFWREGSLFFDTDISEGPGEDRE